jgi:hypothetical protein
LPGRAGRAGRRTAAGGRTRCGRSRREKARWRRRRPASPGPRASRLCEVRHGRCPAEGSARFPAPLEQRQPFSYSCSPGPWLFLPARKTILAGLTGFLSTVWVPPAGEGNEGVAGLRAQLAAAARGDDDVLATVRGVGGRAWRNRPRGVGDSHNTLPVLLSKARNFSSIVPATNTSPPAVTMVPPKFSVPVGGTPRAFSSGCSPSGTRHKNSPRFRSTAVRCPHGGLTAG